MKRIKEIFEKLKEAHPYVLSGTEEQKRRIYDLMKPLIAEAETLGVPIGFCDTLLFFGREFLEREYPDQVKKNEDDELIRFASRLFHASPQYMTFGEREAAEIAKKKGAIVYQITGYEQTEVDEETGKLKGAYHPKVRVLMDKKGNYQDLLEEDKTG